ncbi:hypothetical protein FKM82_025749 [Ascaphus truei]
MYSITWYTGITRFGHKMLQVNLISVAWSLCSSERYRYPLLRLKIVTAESIESKGCGFQSQVVLGYNVSPSRLVV